MYIIFLSEKPAGVAIDWRTNKLYWTESEYNWIEVSNLDGTYPTLLFWKNLSEPRDIVVNPTSKYHLKQTCL